MKTLNGVYDMQGSQTKCSVATCGQWLMNWMVQMETLIKLVSSVLISSDSSVLAQSKKKFWFFI